MENPTISIAVIAKNEADRIVCLLKSAAFADEVVVVDSGSTDKTTDICEQMGARVVFNAWPGYAAQKQFAMEQTTSEWVLNLDADEEISEDLAEEIRNVVRNAGPDVHGFSMPRLSRYLGRWIRHGGWYPDVKLRLVRRGSGRWSGDALHERLIVKGKTKRLSAAILHHVYRGISDQVATINRFSDIYAAERAPAGGGFVLAGVGHALVKIFECYVWKLGVLDGIPGLIIAMNSAWYVFLKHAKTWESAFYKK
ncbi:MAG: glycosyltransferase family 2 protein [Proteobacteria bacterium]|nr:glycosyltransferase family 2 protein [Pseudomonadota bacterium]